MKSTVARRIEVPEGSPLSVKDYESFLVKACGLISRFPQYLSEGEGIDSLELAHIIPRVPETLIAIYVGINDAVCNKALVTDFLVRHAHKNVFVFDPEYFGGGDDVPAGTVDARRALNGFEPPNDTWSPGWTYVMIEDPSCTFEDLWHERGYIDMIAAKFEDFTMLSDEAVSRVCFFIDEKAFSHPVNTAREYLSEARKRGDAEAHRFIVPGALEGETDGLVPVILRKGEKLYVANPDFSPCAHAWSNIHPDNKEPAVVNENSAVPLELVVSKPKVDARYGRGLEPAKGSADMTTDWFYRGDMIIRKPLLEGRVKG